MIVTFTELVIIALVGLLLGSFAGSLYVAAAC